MDDGIIFRYGFDNRSAIDYDIVMVITDPRFPRFSTIHGWSGLMYTTRMVPICWHPPARLTMPLKDWFPVRYLASYAAPSR